MAELCKLSEKCDFSEYLEQVLRDHLVCRLVRKWKSATKIAVRVRVIVNFQNSPMYGNSTEGDLWNEIVNIWRWSTSKHYFQATLQPDKCFYKDQECRACRRRDHIAKMCQERSQHTKQANSERKKTEKGRSQKATNLVEQDPDCNAIEAEDLKLFTIKTV